VRYRLAVLPLLGPAALLAQAGGEITRTGATRPVAVATQVDSAPRLDGRLNDPAWARATVLTGFVQHEPFDGRAATERTEVRIVFDRHALYIGARLHDSDAASIVRGEVRRDAEL